jgi:outer membrane lipoprotein-sorting protein
MARTFRVCLVAIALAAFGSAQAQGAATAESVADPAHPPSVDTIIERYVAARGGAGAWEKLATFGWTGHIETESQGGDPVQFLMLFRRPNATRFEVIAKGQRSVRIFDGKVGWKLLPGGETGIQQVAYSPDETTAALDASWIDGPLPGYAAKGVSVTLSGLEPLGSRKAWRLSVKLPSGAVQTHWIDAQDYHELRYERPARDAAGHPGVVTVVLDDYQTIGGLSLPMVIESHGGNATAANRMVIEKISVNPSVPADTFQRPQVYTPRHGGVIVNTADPRFRGAAPVK